VIAGTQGLLTTELPDVIAQFFAEGVYPARFGGISVALLCDDICEFLRALSFCPAVEKALPQEPGWSIAY
jgi:hypothetical protein